MKPRKKMFTDKQCERIRHMVSEGMRQHEIAKIMGCTPSTIQNALKRAKNETRPV